MENVIEGRIIQVLPEESGVSQAGNSWRRVTAVLETADQYPRKVAFQMLNDRIIPLQVNQSVRASINIDSREYNGKWYTNIQAYRVEVQGLQSQQQMQPQPQVSQWQQGTPQYQQAPQQSGQRDLPF